MPELCCCLLTTWVGWVETVENLTFVAIQLDVEHSSYPGVIVGCVVVFVLRHHDMVVVMVEPLLMFYMSGSGPSCL